MRILIILTFGVALYLQTADAQTAADTCISSWERDRHLELLSKGEREAAIVIAKISIRANTRFRETPPCDYVTAMLDELRWASSVKKGEDSPQAMSSYLTSIREELDSPGLSVGEFVTKMISDSQLWRAPSGLLVVESSQRHIQLILNRNERGFTNWLRRLSPGTYSLEALRGGKVIYENRKLQIEDGIECRITVGE